MKNWPNKWWAALAGSLLAISVLALLVIGSQRNCPSWLRDPLWTFAQPGISAWWLTFGGPYQTAPTSAPGMAFAVVANSLLWLLTVRLIVAAVFFVRRRVR